MVVPKSFEEEGLLTPSALAKELGVHRSTVHNWLRSGLLKSKRRGSFHTITRAEVARFSSTYVIEPQKRGKKKGKKK